MHFVQRIVLRMQPNAKNSQRQNAHHRQPWSAKPRPWRIEPRLMEQALMTLDTMGIPG